MLRITLENARKQQILITNEVKFTLDKVTGLNPPTASIYTTENIGDGNQFQHQRTGERNVVINMYINGDVEKNRLELYNYVQTGQYIKIYIDTDSRNVWIEGYVETCEIDQFQRNTTCQISIICPEPYWKDLTESINTINSTQSTFYFPYFTVTAKPVSTYEQIQILNLINQGNAVSGMTIELTARGTVINPIIYNRETREYIGLGNEEKPYTMQSGDRVVITTHTNNKKAVLIRDAVETNIFNALIPGSSFLQVDVGENIFTFATSSGSEYLDIVFKHYSLYKGI